MLRPRPTTLAISAWTGQSVGSDGLWNEISAIPNMKCGRLAMAVKTARRKHGRSRKKV